MSDRFEIPLKMPDGSADRFLYQRAVDEFVRDMGALPNWTGSIKWLDADNAVLVCERTGPP